MTTATLDSPVQDSGSSDPLESVKSKFAQVVPWLLGLSGVLLAVYLVSLIVRSGSGSLYAPIDGWGVSAFEVAIGILCISRFFDPRWRSTNGIVRYLPIILGGAILCWAFGDVAQATESIGGATPPVPSMSDGLYLCFFPACYVALGFYIRSELRGKEPFNWIDGAIAGFGTGAVVSAYLFRSIQSTSGGSGLSTATLLAYPVGDVLLGAARVNPSETGVV